MSPTNEQLARCVIDAFNDRDVETFERLVTDDFEWVTPTASHDEARTYRGRLGIRRFFEEASVWERIETRVIAIRDLGDRALLLGELSWCDPRRGPLEVTGPFSSVFHFEDDRISRIETFRRTGEAVVAAYDHRQPIAA